MASSIISDEDEVRFQAAVTKMRACMAVEDVENAARHAESALKIRPSEKLSKRLAKMKVFLEEVNDEMVDLSNGLYVQRKVAAKLYAYQKHGLLWLWKLHQEGKGGILGDDMGLGKTVQVITFLCALFDLEKIKSALIIMPVTLIENWKSEFGKWADDLNIYDFHESTKKKRVDIIERVQRRGGVVIATYGLLVSNHELLSRDLRKHGCSFVWDYMILDEGQKIKNPSKCTQGANAIPSNHRIVLTGTPIQNNLMELWSLFDFVHQGTLLGTRATFRTSFELPIKHSLEKNATVGEKRLGEEMAVVLRKKINPYFLRRLKSEVIKENVDENDGDHARPESLKRKNDLVVWIRLSKVQLRIYQDFLERDEVQEVLRTKKSPLMQLNILKKICDHPRLMNAEKCQVFGLDEEDGDADGSEISYANIPNNQLLEESGKLKFLILLLQHLSDTGHRTLVFSRTRCILNITERLLTEHGIRFLRIDGTVKPSDRLTIINKFNSTSRYSVMLLTTQVGGEGLTITMADRVVIYDPGWNPAQDEQAVDRCYRIGQKKAVIVYRLMTCATVEEKIYRRQVFKQSIHKQMLQNDQNPYRYFGKQELYDLFNLEDPQRSATQMQLERMHGEQRRSDTELDHHIATLHSFDIFGISDHDLLFTIAGADKMNCDAQQQKYIDSTVKRAEDLLSMETDLSRLAIENGTPRIVPPTGSPMVTRQRTLLKPPAMPVSNTVKSKLRKSESLDEHDESILLEDSFAMDPALDATAENLQTPSESISDDSRIVHSDGQESGDNSVTNISSDSVNDCKSDSSSDDVMSPSTKELDDSRSSHSNLDITTVPETDVSESIVSNSYVEPVDLDKARKLRRSSMLFSLKSKIIDDETEDDIINLVADNTYDSSIETGTNGNSSGDDSDSDSIPVNSFGSYRHRRIINSDSD